MNEISSPINMPPLIVYVIMVWSIIWKGLALWHSSKNNQRNWFIVLLVINTIGILDIIYLFRFCKKRLTLKDLVFWKAKKE
jgi:hypothetical protein